MMVAMAGEHLSNVRATANAKEDYAMSLFALSPEEQVLQTAVYAVVSGDDATLERMFDLCPDAAEAAVLAYERALARDSPCEKSG